MSNKESDRVKRLDKQIKVWLQRARLAYQMGNVQLSKSALAMRWSLQCELAAIAGAEQPARPEGPQALFPDVLPEDVSPSDSEEPKTTDARPQPEESDEALAGFAQAYQEAKNFGYDYIHTDHVLLGIVQQQNSTASNALESANVSYADLVRLATTLTGHEPTGFESYPVKVPFSRKTVKVLEGYN